MRFLVKAVVGLMFWVFLAGGRAIHHSHSVAVVFGPCGSGGDALS